LGEVPHFSAAIMEMTGYHMLTNGKLTQDGVTSLSHINLNKILRGALCLGFASYLQGLLSWKIWTQF